MDRHAKINEERASKNETTNHDSAEEPKTLATAKPASVRNKLAVLSELVCELTDQFLGDEHPPLLSARLLSRKAAVTGELEDTGWYTPTRGEDLPPEEAA